MKIKGKIKKKINEYFNIYLFRFLKSFVIAIWNSDYSDTLLNSAIDQFSWLGTEEMESDIQKWIGVYMALQGDNRILILLLPETKEIHFWEL